jgi:hypothetical protein
MLRVAEQSGSVETMRQITESTVPLTRGAPMKRELTNQQLELALMETKRAPRMQETTAGIPALADRLLAELEKRSNSASAGAEKGAEAGSA